MKTKEIFDYDLYRVHLEIEANLFRFSQGKWKRFNDERIQSNNLPFRKAKFEDVIFNYQIPRKTDTEETFFYRCKKIQDYIDSAKEGIDKWEPKHQFAYYRIDTRNLAQAGDPIEKDGKKLIPVESKFPQHLEKIREQHKAQSEDFFANNEIMLWAIHKYKGDEPYTGYKGYDASPKEALKDIKILCIYNHHNYNRNSD